MEGGCLCLVQVSSSCWDSWCLSQEDRRERQEWQQVRVSPVVSSEDLPFGVCFHVLLRVAAIQ